MEAFPTPEFHPESDQKPNILELTPPNGTPDLGQHSTTNVADFTTTLDLGPITLLIPGAEEIKPDQKKDLDVQELIRRELMRIVWQQPDVENNDLTLQIGVINHSEALRNALQAGGFDGLLEALSEAYREIYGGDPWNEYLCCSNPACKGTRSLKEVFGPRAEEGPLKKLETESPIDPKDFSCPLDGAKMEYFYDPEQHLEALRESFHEQVFATLLFQGDHRLLGFCLGFETTVAEGWDDKVIPGRGDESRPRLEFEEYMAEALALFGKGTSPEDHVLNVAEWGIKKGVQGKGTALRLMQELYTHALKKMQSTSEADVPVFAHSLDGSRAFQVTSKVGFQWGQTLPSGERRAYLTLKKAIEGIERMMEKNQVKILPVEEKESAEKNIPRDTLVIEMLCSEAVGSDENGNKKVHQYLAGLAEMLGLKPIGPSVTHLSPKYGLSGWLPLANGAAIHLYAWDYEDGSHPPFLSIDISTQGSIKNPELVINHAEKFFKADGPSVQKKMQERENQNWNEIAPQILRQRITIAGKPRKPLQQEDVKAYLRELAPQLDMLQLSEPLVIGQDGWMHWETSGVVLHWDEHGFTIDIYTCKAFDPQAAIDFTVSQLGLENPRHKNF